MSGANAIHGIVIVGAMLVASAIGGPLGVVLGFLAVVLGTANVVGGFVVTDRMLAMFKQRSRGGMPPSNPPPKPRTDDTLSLSPSPPQSRTTFPAPRGTQWWRPPYLV